MTPFLSFTVQAEQEGHTVGQVLRQEYSVSRTLLRKVAREGEVRVGGTPASLEHVLHEGQKVELCLLLKPSVPPEPGPLDVLYEDKHILVVEKPAGRLVHPTDMAPTGSVVAWVAHHLQKQGEPAFVGPVTRLDRQTSGLLLLAKHPHAHYRLARAIEQDQLERTYLALVDGWVEEDAGCIDAPIRRVDGSLALREVGPDGQRAVTHFQVVGRYGVDLLAGDVEAADQSGGRATLLKVRLETGRTHQIRVHMAYLGHPLIGDSLYGKKSVGPLGHLQLKRQGLHACELRFEHPVSGAALCFTSPIPADMQVLLDSIKQIQ